MLFSFHAADMQGGWHLRTLRRRRRLRRPRRRRTLPRVRPRACPSCPRPAAPHPAARSRSHLWRCRPGQPGATRRRRRRGPGSVSRSRRRLRSRSRRTRQSAPRLQRCPPRPQRRPRHRSRAAFPCRTPQTCGQEGLCVITSLVEPSEETSGRTTRGCPPSAASALLTKGWALGDARPGGPAEAQHDSSRSHQHISALAAGQH